VVGGNDDPGELLGSKPGGVGTDTPPPDLASMATLKNSGFCRESILATFLPVNLPRLGSSANAARRCRTACVSPPADRIASSSALIRAGSKVNPPPQTSAW
jgi:hypothetical protein